jgi:hypothetical protein
MKRTLPFLRGLLVGVALSVTNLAGIFLMLTVLGGLHGWTTMQFVGAFGLYEIGTAFAFVFAPNLWRLPVEHAEGKPEAARLSAGKVFVPHWAGSAKALAGIVMLGVAARSEGIGPLTWGVVPFAFATGALLIAASAAAARFGVTHPSVDVVQFVVRRPGRKELEIPGISISAALIQVVLGAFTLPTVKLLPPESLYGPEVGPAPAFLAAMVAVAAAMTVVALWVWRGRMTLRSAHRRQPAPQSAR